MILRGAPPIFATSPSLMDVISEGAGNPETSPPIDVFPVDAFGIVEGCPSSGFEVDVGVDVGITVGYGSGEYGPPSGGGGGPGASSAVTGEDVEMLLDGCDSLDERDSLEGINALQMAIPENRSTIIAVNTTIILFFIFLFCHPLFFYIAFL
nr:hypothetical protein BSM_10210 [uncultured archaeon]